jgi:hypothetical protein
MLDAREYQSKVTYRAFGFAFSLPRGERMRCGVFFIYYLRFSTYYFGPKGLASEWVTTGHK